MEDEVARMFSHQLVEALARANMPAYVGICDYASMAGHSLQEEAKRVAQIIQGDYSITIELEHEISKLRVATLRASYGATRPKPLNHPDLELVIADKHGLVDMSLFDQGCGGLAFGQSVFEILPAIDSRNSSYWTLRALNALPASISPKIRLDPLMCAPREDYRAMFYLMDVFGQPLNWRKILRLTKEITQRWMPDQPDESDVAFTDAVWTPRGDEVHLRCEECPKPFAASFRPSRYFHAIINRGSQSVVHCDGALRIFTRDQIKKRNEMHVRDAGKMGIRVKLFQIDDEIDSKAWATLLKSFFLWNLDIEKFANELSAD